MPRNYISNKEHQCSTHQHYLHRSVEYYIDRVKKVSEPLAQLIALVFSQSRYPKQLYRSCDGLFSLHRNTPYTYNLFMRLSRYHLDGRYLVENNLAENAIRPLAVGRKGYLFCGNHEAAENAAIMYSLLGCSKARNPREWFTDVFIILNII